jgi:hypothetical protein
MKRLPELTEEQFDLLLRALGSMSSSVEDGEDTHHYWEPSDEEKEDLLAMERLLQTSTEV